MNLEKMKTGNGRSLSLLRLTVALAGCGETPVAVRENRTNVQDVASAEQDELEQGLLQLIRLYEEQPEPIERLCLYYLNQWLLREAKEAGEWKPHPLVAQLPGDLASIQAVAELNRKRYTPGDYLFVQGRLVSRDLVKWAGAKPVEEPLATWLAQRKLPEDQSAALARACVLFDWVVRNVQLDSLPELEAGSTERWSALAQRGDDGPGYRHYVHDTLLVGHGDAWERLHLFIQLCRQAKIEVVAIGSGSEGKTPWRPWTAGVLIGDDIYLFDPELGLPIPSENDRGVATLREAVAHPDRIRQLDLDERRPYRFATAQLENLEVRLVAMPEELSLRMGLLQSHLKNEYAMSVTYDPQPVIERLRSHKELSPVVKLWDVPFITTLYCELGHRIRLSKDEPFAISTDREMAFLARGELLEQARRMHFQGIFQPQEPLGGAIQLYMQNRPSEFSLDEIRMSKKFRERVGLEQILPKDPEKRKMIIDLQVEKTRRLRENTSFWLGLLQYEQGEYATAVDWFGRHSLDISPDNFWTRAARYNLARSYERLGKFDEAVKLYRIDASPQRHGNLVRARRLTRETNMAPAAKDETPATKDASVRAE